MELSQVPQEMRIIIPILGVVDRILRGAQDFHHLVHVHFFLSYSFTRPVFEFGLSYFLAVWLWEMYLTSLILSFLICAYIWGDVGWRIGDLLCIPFLQTWMPYSKAIMWCYCTSTSLSSCLKWCSRLGRGEADIPILPLKICSAACSSAAR